MLSSELVPGDVIIVPDHGCQLLCDAVLLSGSVIMNESMLTGESVPVTKTALLKGSGEEVVYCNKTHEKSSLKCGTMVIQTRKAGQELVTAVVIRLVISSCPFHLGLCQDWLLDQQRRSSEEHPIPSPS